MGGAEKFDSCSLLPTVRQKYAQNSLTRLAESSRDTSFSSIRSDGPFFCMQIYSFFPLLNRLAYHFYLYFYLFSFVFSPLLLLLCLTCTRSSFFLFEEPFEWKHYFLLRSFDYLSVQANIQSGWKYKNRVWYRMTMEISRVLRDKNGSNGGKERRQRRHIKILVAMTWMSL